MMSRQERQRRKISGYRNAQILVKEVSRLAKGSRQHFNGLRIDCRQDDLSIEPPSNRGSNVGPRVHVSVFPATSASCLASSVKKLWPFAIAPAAASLSPEIEYSCSLPRTLTTPGRLGRRIITGDGIVSVWRVCIIFNQPSQPLSSIMAQKRTS